MYRLLFICGLAMAGPATAGDDLYSSVSPNVTDWSGFRAGIFGGTINSFGEAKRTDYTGALLSLDVQNGLFPESISGIDTSLSGGVAVGYDVQKGRWVVGAEADISYANLDVTHYFSRRDPYNTTTNPHPINPAFAGLQTDTTYRTKFGSIATARLRGGISFDSRLVYATAGVAYGKIANRFSLALPGLGYTSPDWSDEGWKLGYAVGVGYEQKLTDKIGLRMEVLAVDLADTTIRATDSATFPGQTIDYTFRNRAIMGRFGVMVAF